ncbi:hypothetical protein ABT160_18940 [Streptomyces sp. NPDC001941]|uniref:hypothetical protein n=1 Tax=Streptomyces sp. NPDC001941 TaxID=3154659 RepID=UPI003329D709
MTVHAAAMTQSRPGVPGGTVAIIAPADAGARLALEYHAQGWESIAVALPADQLPPQARSRNELGALERAFTHQSMRRTLKRLRAAGVTAVVAGSAWGVALADRLAEQLDLAGNSPATSWLRNDRGVQAAAVRDAGLAAPRSMSTTSLMQALRWAEFCRLGQYSVACADTAVPLAPVVCRSESEIRQAWIGLRALAPRYTLSTELVIQEYLPGRRYIVDTVSGSIEQRPAVIGLWHETYDTKGLHQRTDSLSDSGLLGRSLGRVAQKALPVLGVDVGPARLEVVHTPGAGMALLSVQAFPQESPAGPLPCHANDPIRAAAVADVAGLVHPVSTARRFTTRLTLAASRDGIVDAGALSRLRALPSVAYVSPALTASAPVKRTVDDRSSPGYVILDGYDRNAVEDAYRTIRALEITRLYSGTRASVL